MVDFVGLPGTEIPGAGENSRAGSRAFEDYRPQQAHEFRKQPHGHDGRVAKVHVERVTVLEADAVRQAFAPGALIGFLNEIRIDFDPPAA